MSLLSALLSCQGGRGRKGPKLDLFAPSARIASPAIDSRNLVAHPVIHHLPASMAASSFSGSFSASLDDDPSRRPPLTLGTIREALIQMEDTILFALIQRASYPLNSSVYDHAFPGPAASLLEFIVKETEATHAKVGRYENPEERAFFPDALPSSLLPLQGYSKVLHPAAASININQTIWNTYVHELLPLFCSAGDDGNYASTAACDLACLQALSRRIHYGVFVAEVKFIDAQQDYSPAIIAQDRDALMKLLTFESVEEMVKRRVEKKAMLFGQKVNLDDKGDSKYKINPTVASRLYGDWVMPFTKLVQVEYLLRRLD